MAIPAKASYYLTHTLVFKSKNEEVKSRIGSTGRKCKGKEYNSALVPFIITKWDIEAARLNSDSLSRMIRRIKQLEQRLD